MIRFLTTSDHSYTLQSLADGTFGFPVPEVEVQTYECIILQTEVAKATYVFTDLERLTPAETRVASCLYQALRQAGLRVLNDPARVKLRVEFLREMHRHGINPFRAYRADDNPQPDRFPVFLRSENDHLKSGSALILDRRELEAALAKLQSDGVPLRGMLVIEFCSSPYAEGIWHKWGTLRAASTLSLDHIAVDDNWLVKTGQWEMLAESIVADEYDAVLSNRFADASRQAFDIACIEFGRADHGLHEGKPIFYEINTNPFVGPYVRDSKLLRAETQILARTRFAAALERIDCPDHGAIELPPVGDLETYRRTGLGSAITRRP